MKKLSLLISFIMVCVLAYAQGDVTAKRLTAKDEFKPPLKDTTFAPTIIGQLTTRPQDKYTYTAISITAGTKRWERLARFTDIAANSGSPNSNVGTGYRFAVPTTNNIKTFIPILPLSADSTSTANTITLRLNGLTNNGSAGNMMRVRSDATGWEYFMPSFVSTSDTAAMLANYRHWLANYLKTSDTATMLANYRHWTAGYLTAIPTLQQVLTAGPNISGAITTNFGGNSWWIRGTNGLGVYMDNSGTSMLSENYLSTGTQVSVTPTGFVIQASSLNNTTNAMLVGLQAPTDQVRLVGQRSNGNLGYTVPGYGINITSAVLRLDTAVVFPALRATIESAEIEEQIIIVKTPLYGILGTGGDSDTLAMRQASDVDSGWVSKEQVAAWNAKLGDAGSNGIAVRTNVGTTVSRTLMGTTDEVAVSNGTGVSGNPTISLPSTLNLTGKAITVQDNNWTMQDNTTPSKKFVFDASGISPSTTRTISIPDGSGNLVLDGGYQNGAVNVGTLQVNSGQVELKEVGSLSTPASTYLRLYAWSGSANGSIRYIDDAGSIFTVANTAESQTFSNKRWTPRVGSTTSSATPTINTDLYDIYKLTAQSANITSFTTNLSGTPVDGDILEIQITGTAARTISWGASFVSSTVTLPSTTVTTATLTVIFQYYTTSSYGNNKWVCANYY